MAGERWTNLNPVTTGPRYGRPPGNAQLGRLPGRLPLVAALKTCPAPSGSGNLGSKGEGSRTQGGRHPYLQNLSRTNTSQNVLSL